jgi:translation initiation factor IF-2
MLAGKHHGKIKAMHDERIYCYCWSFYSGICFGLWSSSAAGDKFNIFEDEKKQNKLRQNVLN